MRLPNPIPQTLIALGLLSLAAVFAAADAKVPAKPELLRVFCADHETMRDGLKKSHGEVPVSAGVNAGDPGSLVQLYANPERTSWTLLYTPAGGPSCAIASGTGWVDFPDDDEEKPKGEPS